MIFPVYNTRFFSTVNHNQKWANTIRQTYLTPYQHIYAYSYPLYAYIAVHTSLALPQGCVHFEMPYIKTGETMTVLRVTLETQMLAIFESPISIISACVKHNESSVYLQTRYNQITIWVESETKVHSINGITMIQKIIR